MNSPALQILPDPVPEKLQKSIWVKTKYNNIYKYAPTGSYHFRGHIRGDLVRKSLNTKSIEIAQTKAAALTQKERGRLATKYDEDLTFLDLAEEFIDRLKREDLKPRSRDYRIETLKQIRTTWPTRETSTKTIGGQAVYAIDGCRWKDFTDDAVLKWADHLRKTYSPSRYNGAIQTMRAVLQVGVDRGLFAENPARARERYSEDGVPNAPVPAIPPSIPSDKKFKELLARLDAIPSRAQAAIVVRFLAFGGPRIGAARQIYPHHIDLVNNEIKIPKIKYDQHDKVIPMIPEMRALVEKLLHDYPGSGPLLPIKNPRRALRNACKEAGIEPLTNHDLRHVFASKVIEIPGMTDKVLGEWLGHSDGGRLASRLYAHLRREHSQKLAAQMNFGGEVKSGYWSDY